MNHCRMNGCDRVNPLEIGTLCRFRLRRGIEKALLAIAVFGTCSALAKVIDCPFIDCITIKLIEFTKMLCACQFEVGRSQSKCIHRTLFPFRAPIFGSFNFQRRLTYGQCSFQTTNCSIAALLVVLKRELKFRKVWTLSYGCKVIFQTKTLVKAGRLPHFFQSYPLNIQWKFCSPKKHLFGESWS